MRKWVLNIGFLVICGTALLVLLLAPPVKTARRPNDPTHTDNPKQFEACPACHMPGGEGPEMVADHFNKAGQLKLDHQKCYMCHKDPEPEKK